jgi:hypothetical protein
MASVRRLLRRAALTPRQIVQLGQFLQGRLPRVTDGFSMSVALKVQERRNLNWYEVRLDDDSFQLNSGGSVDESGTGPDSLLMVAYEVGQGWRGDEHWSNTVEWLESFRQLVDDPMWAVSISDDGDGAGLHTDDDDETDYWTRLAQSDDDEGED